MRIVDMEVIELSEGSLSEASSRRATLTLSLAIIALLLSSGCAQMGGGQGNGQGDFELLVSDAPADIGNFDSLDVTFSEARVFESTGENESEGSFQEFDLNGTTVDLTTVVGDRAIPISRTSLAEGNYSKVELHVSAVEGVVAGEPVDVKVPSEKLQITKTFEVRANETTKFVFDINVVRKGAGGYNLLPVIAKSGVVGKDVEVEEVEPGDSSGGGGAGGPPEAPGAPDAEGGP